jgi:hypothetical protein
MLTRLLSLLWLSGSMFAAAATAAAAADEAAPYALVTRPSDPQHYNRVEKVALDPMTLKPLRRTPLDVACTRVSASAAGEMLCLSQAKQGSPGKFTPITTYLFSKSAQTLESFERRISGRPSRARISADGKYTATTTFVTGHSYLGVAGTHFSTETIISTRAKLSHAHDIQQWEILSQGKRVTSPDLNLWGVTFDRKNSDTFFVTAYFDGVPYLAKGSVSRRQINAVLPKVECPSLSPDGTRIAFKRRISDIAWAPAVLELATLKERVFDVPQSVDDQIEWIDDHTIVYEVVDRPLIGSAKVNLHSLDIRADSPAQALWMEDARSPTFVR